VVIAPARYNFQTHNAKQHNDYNAKPYPVPNMSFYQKPACQIKTKRLKTKQFRRKGNYTLPKNYPKLFCRKLPGWLIRDYYSVRIIHFLFFIAYHGISRRPFYLSNMFPYAVFAFWKMNRSIIVLAPLIWLKLYSEGSLHKLGFYCSS